MQRNKTGKYWNTKLSPEKRAQDLVSKMTLREKISQMLHTAPPIPRLGISAYNWWNECLHGVARAGRATVFPQAIGMAASFDVPLMSKVAAAISDEARAKHHDSLKLENRDMYQGLTYWSPNINIFRDPRWGRGQETYGEDPFLTARMGVAFVKGLQGNNDKYLKLVATAKHYAVHSGPESLRHSFNAKVGMRDLWETYLPAFEALVKEAKVRSIMGAYNRTNGEPCCGSPTLLQKILREKWGFEGYVVSDCWALRDFHQGHKVTKTAQESVAMALRNGCDINCGLLYKELLNAVKSKLVSETDVDRACVRLFAARFELGMFDPPEKVPFSKIKPSVVRSAKHRRLALQMARESIVMLENKDNTLPLDKNVRRLAVVGPSASDTTVLLGNYSGFSDVMTSVAEGVLGKVRAGTQVFVGKGCDHAGKAPIWYGECNLDAIKSTDATIVAVGYTADIEGEEGCVHGMGGDRLFYELPGRQMEMLKQIRKAAKKLIVVVMAGSPVDLSWIASNADAVLFAWYPGEAGGEAVADILFGDFNPSGRLPITFPKSYKQLPPLTNYAMKGRTYRFMKKKPMYGFGYGLSFSTFKYSNLKINGLKVSVDITNVGAVDGDEVAQMYATNLDARDPVPLRQLVAFQRVHLRKGQKKTVLFTLKRESLVAYDDKGSPFFVKGRYRISAGGGQPSERTSGAVSAIVKLR